MLDTHDIVAIQQLMAHYGHLVDGKQWPRLGEIFAENGAFDVSAYQAGRHESLSAVIAFFERATHPPAHHSTNLFVYEEAGETRAWSKYAVPSEGGRLYGGDYKDVLVRTTNGWRIKERVVTARWPEK
ncbi:MAG TPA: nuclear transport factor 2 family protein [Myxococcota bacterium]